MAAVKNDVRCTTVAQLSAKRIGQTFEIWRQLLCQESNGLPSTTSSLNTIYSIYKIQYRWLTIHRYFSEST